jgi:hypothetical protein
VEKATVFPAHFGLIAGGVATLADEVCAVGMCFSGQ